MEDEPFTHGPRNSSEPRRSVAINREYAAYFSSDDIHIQSLLHPHEAPRTLAWRVPFTRADPVLSLSAVPPYALAASSDTTIYVFDLNSRSPECILPGTGRSVTSIAFSGPDSKRVATGHVNGSVCLWNLGTPDRAIQRFVVPGAACNVISWSPTDHDVLASAHDGKIYIWNIGRNTSQPICCLEDVSTCTFAWNPRIFGSFATVLAGGEFRCYDFSTDMEDSHTVRPTDKSYEEGDGGVFGLPDDLQSSKQPVSLVRLVGPLKSILWAGNTIVVGLAPNGVDIIIYEVNCHGDEPIWLWSCKFEDAVEAIQLTTHDKLMAVVGIGRNGIKYRTMPADLLGRLNFQNAIGEDSVLGRTEAPEVISTDASKTASVRTTTEECGTPTMIPISIPDRRRETSAFEKTSRQLQHKRRSFPRTSKSDKTTVKPNTHSQKREARTPSPTRTLTSDPDVSIFPDGDEIGQSVASSPSIPSSKISPTGIPSLNGDAVAADQLPEPSFEPSTRTSAIFLASGHDSDDSDDETFVDDMHGSATFLPGGINVPLPKACGALFAPNGQLLLFFPPKPQQPSVPLETAGNEPRERLRKLDRVKKRFPTFGNLESDSILSSEDSDSEDTPSVSDDPRNGIERPRLSFQPASFPTQLSWQSRESTDYTSANLRHSQRKIIVSVREVTDVPGLHQAQQKVATSYRLLCDAGESGAELCDHNARVAEEAGIEDVANLWRLLSLLLADRVPLEALTVNSRYDDILVIARQASLLSKHESGNDFVHSNQQSAFFGKLRWANHAFGGSQLVRRLFEWAEIHADVQCLACFSCALLEAQRNIPLVNTTVDQSMLTHLSTYSPDYFTDVTGRASGRVHRRAIPVLRTHAATITSLHESPTKVLRGSDLSSRITSQPSTPYLNSHGTPPFSFPPISRESTRLSTSGSASPEFQRGSFAAAAKYYAQSFSEKFGPFGTSPPGKKSSTSPTTTSELSSSFPTGSWPGKSVSFASTTTEDTSSRTMATAALRARNDDDEYDSDKTIEDTSAPHTPRSPGDAVAVNVDNQDAFTDEISGSARVKLMPDERMANVTIWNQYYGELLRSWDMLAQAIELEKVAGLANGKPSHLGGEDLRNVAILPATASKQRKTSCEICLTVTTGIMQICPSCLHSSHLQCLEEYIIALEDEEFTCPSGCGCLCSELSYVVQQYPRHSPERPAFKKKASFTDPRRWRARVDGDSW